MKAQKLFQSSLLAAALSLAFSGNAMANVVNGGFDSSLTGWSIFGDVVRQSGGAFLTTASLEIDDFKSDGSDEAAGTFNNSGTSAFDIAAGGFDTFAGTTLTALDNPDQANEGSLLKQTFNVNAGDTLSFNWNMFTNEGTNADYAFVVINGALTKLASATDAIIPSVPYGFSTGASLYSQTFAAASSISLAFGVVDLGDYSVTSALWLDNVKLVAAPVPEPETYAMLIAGLALVGAAARRRKM